MRFDAIRIDRYGRLAELAAGDPGRLGESGLPAVVVILGPNESGKSTFFSFLTTVLYGFKPAARERHPYAPWDGGDPAGWARIALDDGTTLEVSRRLRASPAGTVVVDGRAEEIRNRPLEAARHVSRTVYRQVYALGLSELAALQGESWDLVQDRLVGALGSPDLRPARVVASEFDADANALWRPDRRGRPAVRGLREELAHLAGRLREARSRDRELRGKVEERAAAEAEIEKLQERRQAVRARRAVLEDRLTRLRPVTRALARIRELREAGSGEFSDLAADPRGQLAALRLRRQDAEDRIVKLRRRATEAREAIREHGGRHRERREVEAPLREAARLAAELEVLEADAARASEEAGELGARCEEQAGLLFSVPFAEIETGALEGLPATDVHARLEEVARVHDERRIAEEGLRAKLPATADAAAPGRGRLVAGLATALVGGGLATAFFAGGGGPARGLASGAGAAGASGATEESGVAGWVADLLPGVALPVVAAVLVAVGLAVAAQWAETNRRAKRRRDSLEAAMQENDQRIEVLRGQEARAREAVAAAVEGLPVLSALLDAPRLGLAAALERMSELAARRKAQTAAADELRRRVEETRGEIGRLAAKAGVALGEVSEAHAVLAEALEAAEEAGQAAATAHRELERAEGEAAEAARQWEGAGEELRALEERLAEFGNGDADRGAEAVAARMEARSRADRLEDELRREHPGVLDDLAAEVGEAESQGETWDGLEDAVEAEARRGRRLDAEAEELRAAAGRMESDIGHLGEGERADEVEGRAQVVRARIAETEEARDRAFLLARLVEAGDRRFRARHQPTLLLRAGEHLRQITGSRYDQIDVGGPGDESFYLSGPSEPSPRRVEGSLSQGTREQVYLALRLAVVDHLDEGEERLPLIMDETLVNWDATRRDRAFDLLEQVAQNRQVFFFTCHPAMAAEMEDRGAQVLALNRNAG